MSRQKGMAPPPPPGKPKVSFNSPDSTSLVLMFDDLSRNEKVLNDGTTEEKFLQFALNQEFCRKRWEASEIEVQRVQIELQSSEQEVRKLEMKLAQARELLASETSLRKKSENDRDVLEQKWVLVKELITTDQGGQTINDDTRLRLAKLEASVTSRRGTLGGERGAFSPGGPTGLSPVCEIDSTGSILDASDLSFDNTQGTLGGDESRLRSGRMFKRKSSGGVAQVMRMEKRSRSSGRELNRKSLEALAARRSAGAGAAGLGDLHRNNQYQERNIDDYIPSAPAMSTEDAVLAWQNARNSLTSHPSTATIVPRAPMVHQGSTVTLTPSHPSTTTLTPTTPYTPSNPVRRTYSNTGMNRKHQFVQKNNFKTEVCGPCQKRIKFGKICYKCRECRAISHPECREQVLLPCVPTGSAQKTPSKPGYNKKVLADHTPPTSPMVPAVVVHCVHEIEARGLCEVGLYRVPGSEREVKDMRDKFLACRGCPNLSQADVHTLCGVVKDFFRSLREPLIPHSMWSVFTQGATNPDMTDAMSALFQAVSELPQPNRETMAFMMLHLQKVSESHETKMSVSNLAKILGPTIVGYSTADPQPEEILREVEVQACTMEKLIMIDTDYWSTFLAGVVGEELYRDNRILSPLTPDCIFRTPMESMGGTRTPSMSMRSGGRRQEQGQGQGPASGHVQQVQATTGRIFSSPVLL
eukprot:GFUD01044031.1.p1 GENE.GFUD01044031.1~~GFUD01044031.1.p1  ORF type:complete len:697 (-),score=180.39 GFUD01044031.1:226-2316(-)